MDTFPGLEVAALLAALGGDILETPNVHWQKQCMKECQYTVIIERQSEGEYLVSVPVLPGCYTEGSTLEKAREVATDAIRAHCASLLKHGEPIPCESPEEKYIGRLSVALEPA